MKLCLYIIILSNWISVIAWMQINNNTVELNRLYNYCHTSLLMLCLPPPLSCLTVWAEGRNSHRDIWAEVSSRDLSGHKHTRHMTRAVVSNMAAMSLQLTVVSLFLLGGVLTFPLGQEAEHTSTCGYEVSHVHVYNFIWVFSSFVCHFCLFTLSVSLIKSFTFLFVRRHDTKLRM